MWQLGKRILYFVLVLAGQYLLFWLTGWLFRKLKVRIQKLKDTRLKPISIQNYELLDTQRQVNLLIFLSNLLRYVIMLLQLLITVLDPKEMIRPTKTDIPWNTPFLAPGK